MRAVVVSSLLAGFTAALPSERLQSGPDPALETKVTFGGKTFINKGLVALGVVPANAKDSYGETLGGFGSAAVIKRGTFRQNKDGSFSGSFIAQPDRGFNVEKTIDWQTRHHTFDFVLQPYYDAAPLSYASAKKTLSVTYKSTLLYTFNGNPTSGLDPGAVDNTLDDDQVEYPIAAAGYPRLSTDPEGLVENADGSFWISDEYGPYIYRVSPAGEILQTIVPPAAFIPKQKGVTNFTGEVEPTSGRAANQGLEGLAASPSGDKLYALLQSAVTQEGGGDKDTNRYARFLKYNVSDLDAISLEAEYVVPLPQTSKGKSLPQSELLWLNKDQFLVLARDGKGHGDEDDESSYKAAGLIDISKATNIAGTSYDSASGSVAPGGKLVSSVKPAVYETFVQYIDDEQLSRFGLHNGAPVDETLINSKWEGLAIAPAFDKAATDDYFLFTFSDNDFQTRNGVALGAPYDAGIDVPSQILVYRVTLPTTELEKIKNGLGI